MVPVDLLLELERHGVLLAHYELLLQGLRLQRSGSLRWRWQDGRLVACDLHVSVPAQGYAVHEACTVWDGPGDGRRAQP